MVNNVVSELPLSSFGAAQMKEKALGQHADLKGPVTATSK